MATIYMNACSQTPTFNAQVVTSSYAAHAIPASVKYSLWIVYSSTRKTSPHKISAKAFGKHGKKIMVKT